MQAVADGKLDVSDEFIEHMNCCVGCRACETACPSGVQFGKLIEAAREHIHLQDQQPNMPVVTGESEQASRPATQEKIAYTLLRHFFFSVMLPSRTTLSLVFGGLKLYQRSGLQSVAHRTGILNTLNKLPTPFQGQLKLPEELMSGVKGEIIPNRLPEITPAINERKYRVGFLSGCIMDQVFHDVNEASIRVLTTNGCEVITPVQQSCCGALHIHGGEAERGRELARQNIDTFEAYNFDAIIINSAGCGSTLKEYGHLLRDDPEYAERAKKFSVKVKDISEFLADIELRQPQGKIERTVAYHDACHLVHGQKIKQQPRQVLKAIPGLTMIDLKEADWCCGSAGIYNITNQDMAHQLLERKMNNIEVTGATTIATGNPGCMMQIAMGARQRGLELEVVHPIQILDEAYNASGYYVQAQQQDTVTKAAPKQVVFIGAVLGVSIALFLLGRGKKQDKTAQQ
jgi:glycolate oxidase iron-sulfur subunit